MAEPDLYPLLMNPALHTKLWGSRRLQTALDKALPSDEPYGESWEIHDSATVANGPLAGQSLAQVLASYGSALIGTHNDPTEGFPLLAKFIDAADWLSVQVHPNDEQALALEGEPRGKTEAWLILHTEPGSRLVTGMKPGTNPGQMAQAIRENVLEDLLVYETVQTGDVFFIPANTVHAIGPGILIYEIQQSSDQTYRLYDWGRVDLNGKPRALHIDKGVQVSNLSSLPVITHPEGDHVCMVSSPYFETMRHRLHGEALTLATEGKFQAITALDGACQVSALGQTVSLSRGQSLLIPASAPNFTLQGAATLLRSYQT